MVPFQQYRLKHCLQILGTFVFVRSKLLLSIAHPTQAGQSLFIDPFPWVARSYPFRMTSLRFVSLKDMSKVERLE